MRKKAPAHAWGLHGSVYEYLRNRVVDARNFFDPADRPELVRNQFGFSVGGPVVRDKTYFFASTDFFRDREGLSELSTVPTAQERGGNLSALGVPLINPLTGAAFNAVRHSPGLTSPVASDVIEDVCDPSPNLTGLADNYLASPVQRENDTQGNYRVDHHLSSASDITARYSFGLVDLFEPSGGSANGAPSTNTTPRFWRLRQRPPPEWHVSVSAYVQPSCHQYVQPCFPPVLARLASPELRNETSVSNGA